MLTILLTSYNRPRFVKMAIESLQAQTADNWQCIILDDNSNAATLKAINSAIKDDDRFLLLEHNTTKEERLTTSRYAVLINSQLEHLNSGIVAYMCDNVEYKPELVETVMKYFDDNPDAFMGYVRHERDAWTPDGKMRLGTASYYNHWNHTPPTMKDFTNSARGYLDHSQVFHRLPVDLRWHEGIETVKAGDGVFFDKLIAEYGALSPITDEALTVEHLIK